MRWAAAGGELRPGHVGEAVGGQESPPPRPFTKSPPRFAEPPSGWGRPSTSHPLGCSAPALAGGGRKGGGGGGEGRRPAAEGGEEKEAVPVPPQFLCPISSRIMTDPVIVASGQVRSQLRFFTGFGSVLGEFWCAIAVKNHHCPPLFSWLVLFFFFIELLF